MLNGARMMQAARLMRWNVKAVDTPGCSEWDGESFIDVFLPFTCSFCFRIDLSYQLSLRLDIPVQKAVAHPSDRPPIVLKERVCYTSKKKSRLCIMRSTGRSGRSEVSCGKGHRAQRRRR